MGLTAKLSQFVDGGVRRRGGGYFARGAVSVMEGDNWSVLARVRGGSEYIVTLKRQRKTVRVSCTCPYFETYLQPCKHTWAALLAAEGEGYLRGPGDSGPSSIYADARAVEQPDADVVEEDDIEDEEEAYGPYNESAQYQSYAAPPRSFQPVPRRHRKPSARSPDWKQHLASLRGDRDKEPVAPRGTWPPGREVLYVIDVPATLAGRGLVVDLAQRQRKKDGQWSKPRFDTMYRSQLPQLPDPEDGQILALLGGAEDKNIYWNDYGYSYYDALPRRFSLSKPVQDALLPRICRTGRCFIRASADQSDLRSIRWDEGSPWELWLQVAPDEQAKHYLVTGSLRRGEERMPLTTPVLLTEGGIAFWEDRASPVNHFDAFDWITLLRRTGALSVSTKEKDKLLNELLRLPRLPRLDLPEELRFEEVPGQPKPRLKVHRPERNPYRSERLRGELTFAYEGEIIAAERPDRGVYQSEQRRFLVRDQAVERAAAEQLYQLGFRTPAYSAKSELELAPRNLPNVVRTLLESGWHVEADGKLFRQPGAFRMEVTSGVDWFELHGSVEFGDTVARLPELLAALKRGENTVRLGDGTVGMLPEDWLKKYGMLAGLGTAHDGHVRFSRTQVGLLDALLSAQPEATCDALFQQARDELLRFEGVRPADPPSGFVGELRGYQHDGLGWLYFLQKFGFGGCLADDMGLGKTVQVLALLESRRALRAGEPSANGSADRPGPSLVVVPRSLVFNWKQEAARFTPQLRVLDHTGIARARPGDHFDDHDLIITTYGTLRRDALHFKDVRFDYCILDESQAIKNANTEAAKAVRLLQGNHRLALSGTPIENHLGELWSLFEFLNPGMLGSASVFRLGNAGGRTISEENRVLLARALRPFILRRTKDQVAKDLPKKLEQTIYCEMEPAQRKRYDELRDHYRHALLGRVERDGINKLKIQILEALLRLRQAACHPGLIDKSKVGEASAKLDTLLPRLAEVRDEGHKVLVFSQFTSLLAIVRDRLDSEGIPYEYLDGRTRNRGEKVERFQNDPDCQLFLISLKAGGLGLNLTAAEYVFLLDPWWNPAVEAQAIDRAHRIGQKRQVFAYRLIARDTVEEKVLELQKSKRDLADAIINADNSLIRSLGREELELLLS
jgi:superfamily II DNA or RNA helicase